MHYHEIQTDVLEDGTSWIFGCTNQNASQPKLEELFAARFGFADFTIEQDMIDSTCVTVRCPAWFADKVMSTGHAEIRHHDLTFAAEA